MASSTRTVKVKFDGDAKGLQKAAKDGEREVDRFGKSLDKKFRESGDRSGKSFSSSLKKWFSPSALGDIGKQGGTVFGSGFLGAIKTPVLGPAILAALAAAAAVAAPAAGAIAASGLVLGFGAGLAGLGLVFAAKSKAVKDTWTKTLAGMGADMSKLSKPFEKTLISMAAFARRTFDKFAPALEAVFKEMAPALTKFADQVARGFEQLQPAVRPLAEAFNAVLDSLGPAMQSALGNVSDGLQNLADSVKKNPDGLADLVDGLGKLSQNALDLVTSLNNMNGAFERFTGGLSLVDVALGGANGKIGKFLGFVKDAVNPLSGVTKGLDLFKGSSDKANGSVAITAETTALWTQGLNQGQLAALGVGAAADGTAPKVETLATKFERQWQATQKANEELFRNSGLLLTLSGSQIGYEEAVDRATESVRENGRTHDISTEKGRNNKRALDALATAANVQTESMRNNNKGYAATTKSAEQARVAYVKQAIQMGYTAAEARRMAADFIKIPKKTEADFKGDITDLDAKIAKARKELKDPKLTATKRAKLEAEIAKLLSSKRQAQAAIDALHGKTVQVNIVQQYTSKGVNLTSPSSVGRRASGGSTQPKRRYLFGERGPEIAEFGGTGTGGPRILSAEQTRRELAGGGSQPLVVENHIEIGGEVVRVVRTEIKADNANTKRRQTAGVR